MSTRDRIVAAAAQLYGRYGYNGVGLKQVAAESGAPIGSLYHFFPGGKDELAAEALRLSGHGYQVLVEGVFGSAPDLISGIQAAFAGAAEVLDASGYADACWIETVALEVASTNEPLRLVTAEIFERWIDAATQLVEAGGVPAAEARQLGIAIITGLEGAFVLSRSLRSREPLLATGEALVAAAEAALGARPMTIVRRVFLTALLLSVVHYIDNTVRFDDYTGGKDGFVTQAMIPISWVLFTAAGIAGYRFLKQGNRGLGGSLLGAYSVSGLIGVGHYTTVSPSDFSAFQNTFIGLDFLAGLAVFIMAVQIVTTRGAVSRPRTTTGRSPVGSASR